MSDAPPSVVLQWIPEDDLLLKNSVEHGASLEALAKGAVRFSRKFSVEELRHRWYSLLYDPDISADASSLMVEMEHSACITSSKLNRKNEDVSLKRNFESVRQLYYSMRKKTCHQPLNSAESPVYSHITGDAAAANVVFGMTNSWHTHDPNSIQDDQNAVLRKHDNIDLLEKDPITINSPTRKGLGHPILGDERPKDFPHSVEGVPLNLGIGRGVQDMEHSNASHDGSVSFRIGGYLSPSPRMPLCELTENMSGPAVPVNMNIGDEDQGVGRLVVPDDVREQGYLLDCSMEDELIYGNADGKHTADKSCYDSLDSLLSTSPNDANRNKVLNDKEPQAAPNANFATSAGINAEELEVNVGPSHSTPDFPKPHDRLLNCTLNSEDPEIPSNDDVFLHRPFTTSLEIIVSKEVSNPISVFPNWGGCDQLHLTNREEIPSKSLVTSCIPDNYLPLASHGIKSEFPNSNCHHMLSRIASRNRSQLRSALANPSFASDGVFDGSSSSRYSSDTPVCPIGTIKGLLRPKATAPTTDHEESDDDIPCFSDIEAMMIQMDLSPDDEDSNVLEKFSRYQHEDTKKTIIRLEQCAHSSIQRAIASKGAFAILHGRRLKHYIKETEVILGRATDETDVDIDLRREGCANKISRRQAFIRMGEDGSFFLKNLGKSSMFVNGKEVTTGHHVNLSPSCLIEMSNGKFADQGIGICV